MGEKKTKILVVDDEPDITSHCQSFFGRRGYLVNTTGSGVDAVSMAKTLKPDLIILDRTIPDMNGKDVLKKLREFDKNTKVIILTGHSLNSEEEKTEFYDLGISAYIEKPVVLQDLENIVVKIIGNNLVADVSKQQKLGKPKSKSLRAIAHKMKNILGNMRSECEVFLLNKKDGLYKDKSKEELEQMSDDILDDVIKTVDQAIDVFNKIKEDRK